VRGTLLAATGDAPGARAAFGAALAAAARVEVPFARARAELAHGAFLRRQGQRRAALGHLQAARSTLVRLGARPFLARCDQELAACGLAPDRAGGPPMPHLTTQEHAVAHLVAGGMTNREVALELNLSVKTIEYHLGNVFAKLGTRSRTQLAARLAASRQD
jgi:DNA-binding NarL/FixJ family response regulator